MLMNNITVLSDKKREEYLLSCPSNARDDWKFGFLYGYIEGLRCATEAILQGANKPNE